MSLVGNLEDLGLGDILQIVSLSRKSGVLSLNSRHREGKIVFSNGQVIRALSSVYRENLGHLLLRKALVDLATLKKALLVQRNSNRPPRLGAILAEQFKVPLDAIEAAVREQIEKIVYSFFGWNEGTFSFELGEQGELAATHFDPLQFMLDQGLNPQWLAMEGSRILDEKRHRGEELEEEPVEPAIDLDSLLDGAAAEEPTPVPEPLPAEPDPVSAEAESRQKILLVDDDRLTCQGLFKALGALGHEVESFDAGRDFLDRVDQLCAGGEPPALLIDLIMPRMDGSGILGGLELLELIGRTHPQLEVLILTDHPNQDAENKVRELGFPEVLAKPKKDALRSDEGARVLADLARHISRRFQADAGDEEPQGSGLHHFGRELLAEMGETADERNLKGPESPGLHLLKGMLQELNNPSLGGGIILLVLRFASELMNRAVIFLVKEQEILGLGQFGIERGTWQVDARIRKMRIPRSADSVLNQALDLRSSLRASLGEGEWDRYLRDQLGGDQPQEVFLGPILSEGHVVALIYGDNLPEQKPIGDTESLEIFLSQAGLAMEKALLERRLNSRDVI